MTDLNRAPNARGAAGSTRPGTAAGGDPDARFLLANERTLLAWIRTSLTMLAAGVGVQQLGPATAVRTVIAAFLVALATAAAVTGAMRFAAADRAIRRGELPAGGRAPLVLAAGVGALALVLLVVVLLDLRP